jgi:hypothetical protein
MKNLLTLLPTVIIIPIFFVARAMSAENGSMPLGTQVLVILFILSSTITILYTWPSSSSMLYWIASLQFIAQGAVISILAIQFSLPFLTWTGVLLTLIGLVLSGFKVFNKNR